ncbi:hypothetical protein J2Z44_002223 [Clostridium punense]|uniref:Uncharacterized protein n=1 Tax=Clostridium punense TaxID=1054297 RepID=A0ABS4K3P9_9CLOT|nr:MULTISPECIES: hypothetical protein [Clostridium]EQB89683.1 hypothetical protein M918_19445 [Clostridium sp. BL8]MBP2022402.1 hypothetical protein [Clostridium punense]
MSGIWGNYLLLKVCNTLIIIIALLLFGLIVVKLFKNIFINHCSSEKVWRNIELYLSAIVSLYLSGTSAIIALYNGYAIDELETIGRLGVEAIGIVGENSGSYRDILLGSIQSNFHNLGKYMLIAVIFYFLYTRVVRVIKLEIEELRKNVVHWNFKNKS